MDDSQDYLFEVNSDHQIEIERYIGSDETAVIPDHIDGLPVTVIKEHAFAATDIAEAVVPAGVEIIDSEAFAVCESLRRVILPGSLLRLGRGVFKGSEDLKDIVFSDENARYSVDDGVLFDKSERALVLCPPGLELKKYTVPMGIETISADAFFANRTLEYVKLPLTLKSIEADAFLFTDSMRFIELPPSLESIAPGCFLVGTGPFAEKYFEIYAFPNTPGYRYALENKITVHPLLAIVTD